METETKNLLIGAVIGAVLVWILFGKQQTQTQTISPQQLYQFYQMQSRIQSLEYQLQQNQLQLQTQQSIQRSIQQPIQQLASSGLTNTGYKNNEKWVITRDKTGHIDSLEIVRDAKFSK